MAQYKTGTVSVTNGSAAIVGTGTLWLAEIAAGDLFVVIDDGVTYEVASITDNTHITLSSVYAGTTNAAAVYAISRDFTPVQGYPYPVKGDIETATIIKRAFEMIDTKTTLISTSTTSLTIGTGSKTLTVETGKMFQKGQYISIVDQANNANYMFGQVTSYANLTGVLIVSVVAIGGSGTIVAWNVSISGIAGTTGATGSTGYVYVAYASAADGTGFSNTFNSALDYIAVKSTTTPLSPPIVSDFAGLWKNYKGATGSTGSTGVQGDKGGLRYSFSSTTTASDPGAGIFRFDNATIGSVANIYIDSLAEASADVSAFLTAWTVGSTILISSNANADTSFGIFTITSVTNNTGWFTVGVTFLSGSGFTNTEECSIDYSAKGAAGAGNGDVVGPSSSTADSLARFNGTTGKLLKDGVPIGVAAGNVQQVDQTVSADTRATTTTLGVSLNGTLSDTSATIGAFNGTAGVTYHRRCLGAGIITHHTTDLIITQGMASIVTHAGMTFDVEMLTSTTCRIKNIVLATFASTYSTTQKAIFGYGYTTSYVSMTNLVNNLGVVATDTTGIGTARNNLAAAGYGTD